MLMFCHFKLGWAYVWSWTAVWLVRWCYCGAKQKEFMSFYFSSFAPVWGWETSLIRVSALSVLEILTSISWLSLFRQFHLFPNGLRGWRIGSKLQHITPWYKMYFTSWILGYKKAATFIWTIAPGLWGTVCKLHPPAFTYPHLFPVSFSHTLPIPTLTRRSDVRLLGDHCCTLPAREALLHGKFLAVLFLSASIIINCCSV